MSSHSGYRDRCLSPGCGSDFFRQYQRGHFRLISFEYQSTLIPFIYSFDLLLLWLSSMQLTLGAFAQQELRRHQ
jgi:hypothetical protein